MGEALQKDALDLLIELSYPIFEVGIAFEVQSVDLRDEKFRPDLRKQLGINLRQPGSCPAVRRRRPWYIDKLRGLLQRVEYPCIGR